MSERIEEQPYDDRHNTPPQNPFRKTVSTLDDAIEHLRTREALGDDARAIHFVLAELERLRAPVEFPGGYDKNAPWTPEDDECVAMAIHAVEHPDGEPHWPTVAGWLYAEVQRLRDEATLAPKFEASLGPMSGEAARTTPETYLRDLVSRGLLFPELEGAVRVVLNRMDAMSSGPVLMTNPTPGLTYAGPDGWWGRPAEKESFAALVPVLSILDLRVLSAHLATALDNVTKALHEKGAGA